MATRSPAAGEHTLRILLIEDDLLDAAWLTELIHSKSSTNEVVHRASVPDALSVLDQRPIDTVFVSIRPNGGGASIRDCRDIVRRARDRSVVALINLADMAHAAEVRAAGVRFVYRKHPIYRTGELRKQELREKYAAMRRLGEEHGQGGAPTALDGQRNLGATP
jgi:CheY-like chemotaxis protein